MKFIITESKLNNVIFTYLDTKPFIKIDDGNRIFLLKNNKEEENYSVIFYSRKSNTCFVKKQFVDNVSTFFSLDSDVVLDIISDWVEKNWKVKVDLIEYGSLVYVPFNL
jgi:phage-related protein